jgi:hypothetical protein
MLAQGRFEQTLDNGRIVCFYIDRCDPVPDGIFNASYKSGSVIDSMPHNIDL